MNAGALLTSKTKLLARRPRHWPNLWRDFRFPQSGEARFLYSVTGYGVRDARSGAAVWRVTASGRGHPRGLRHR